MSKCTCCYCNDSFDPVECRPYGPGGKYACFFCAMRPENIAETNKQFALAMQRAASAGTGVVVIGDSDGPQPGPKRIGESN